MVTKCAWCDLVLAETAEPPHVVSHGICPACAAEFLTVGPEPTIETGPCLARLGDCVDFDCPVHATGIGG